MMVIYQNNTEEEDKSRLNVGNACYCSVQNHLPYNLLSKKLKIIIYKTIISSAAINGCETRSLTLREGYTYRDF
jgi:hypothetical protein